MKKNLFRRAINRVLHVIARSCLGATTLRPFFHRLRGVKIGKNVFIGDDIYLENEYPEMVEILDNTVISMRATIIAHTRGTGRVVIGPDVLVGPGVLVVCPVNKTLRIGAGAVINPGAVITSSVAPGILVTPPRSVAAGRVTVLWSAPGSFEEFVAGLRPLHAHWKTPAAGNTSGGPAA